MYIYVHTYTYIYIYISVYEYREYSGNARKTIFSQGRVNERRELVHCDSVKLESVCGLFVGLRAFSRQRPRSGAARADERKKRERESESVGSREKEARGAVEVEERRGLGR